MKSNTERTALPPLGTTLYPRTEVAATAINFDHRSMGSPKRKKHSIKNLGECTSRFVRLLELTPIVIMNCPSNVVHILSLNPSINSTFNPDSIAAVICLLSDDTNSSDCHSKAQAI